jgi:hypothetical protein
MTRKPSSGISSRKGSVTKVISAPGFVAKPSVRASASSGAIRKMLSGGL